MKFTANQIAQILEGEIEGDSEAEVSRLSKIEDRRASCRERV